MSEIVEAINNLTMAVNSLGFAIALFGVLFLFFKNMGGKDES